MRTGNDTKRTQRTKIKQSFPKPFHESGTEDRVKQRFKESDNKS